MISAPYLQKKSILIGVFLLTSLAVAGTGAYLFGKRTPNRVQLAYRLVKASLTGEKYIFSSSVPGISLRQGTQSRLDEIVNHFGVYSRPITISETEKDPTPKNVHSLIIELTDIPQNNLKWNYPGEDTSTPNTSVGYDWADNSLIIRLYISDKLRQENRNEPKSLSSLVSTVLVEGLG